MTCHRGTLLVACGVLLSRFGCTARDVDFSTIQKPARAAELSAFDVFVGEWDWDAEVVNAVDPHPCFGSVVSKYLPSSSDMPAFVSLVPQPIFAMPKSIIFA